MRRMTTVNLRIVNAIQNNTLYEDRVPGVTATATVRAKSEPPGTTRLANGTNNNENPFPDSTCTGALNVGAPGWDG